MSFSKNVLRLFVVLIIMVQVMSLVTVGGFASSDNEAISSHEVTLLSGDSNENESENDVAVEDNTSSETEHVLVPVILSKKAALNECVEVLFDNTGVTEYYYVSDGVTVTEVAESQMQFEIFAVDEFGSVDFYADYVDGTSVKSSIYTYIYNGMVYVSDVSKDTAWYNCMEEQYNQGLITQTEWDERYSELSQGFATEYVPNKDLSAIPMTASEKNTAWGWLSWKLANGTILPLKNTWVELWDYDPIDSECIAGVYTDEEGYFSFTFDNDDGILEGGYDLFIRWYTKSETFEVKPLFRNTYNYIDSGVKYQNVDSGTVSFFAYCVEYDETVIVNKNFYIQQGMIVGQNFAKEMGLDTDNFIHVYYPGTLDGLEILKEIESPKVEEFLNEINNSAFCWGKVFNNCFSIIGLKAFNNIDTLVHEYGHYIEHSMGNYGASLFEIFNINNLPMHNSFDDHFSDKEQKEYAMELTWSESWATAFSQIAQSYYSAEYDGVEGFADLKNTNGGWNYEKFKFDANSGEAQEDAVIAFLWDLFDKYSDTDKNDCIALDYQNWWTFTTRTGTYTLQDFVNVIDQFYPHFRGGVGQLLSEHHISPGGFGITNYNDVSPIVPPVLSWKMNGSEVHPNNMFQVVFYDTYGELIYECEIFSVSLGHYDEYTYSVSQEDWDEILSRCGSWNEINVAVRGYREDEELTSGPYISDYATITKLGAGRCGDDVYWYMSSKYKLTIYGNGNMYDNGDYSQYPWAEYSDDIVSVSIESSVTGIGKYAFAGCSNLVNVNFENPFGWKADNTSIDCLSLIDSSVAVECLINTYVSSNWSTSRTAYGDINSDLSWCLCDDGTLGIYGSGPMPLNGVYGAWNEYKDSITKIVVTGVTSICNNAFSDFDNVTNVYISDTVTKIGRSAFAGCTSLVDVKFESLAGWMVWVMVSDVYIDPYELVFPNIAAEYLVSYYEDRSWTRDTTVTTALSILDSGVCGNGVYWVLTSEYELIIYGSGCMPSYTTVTVDGVAVTTAPWAAYADLFTALRIGEGIYSIGRCAFYNMDNITTVSLPESLMVIEEYAFYDCAGFANFRIPAKVFSIGAYTMRRTAVTNLTLGSRFGWSVNGIALSGDEAEFYNHISGAKVDGVTLSSYKFVFKHEDITDGNIIAYGEFANGTMSWTLNEKGLLCITGSGAMPEFYTNETPWVDYKSIIRYVSIGEGITTVGRCAFFNCFNIEGVTLPSTIVSINEYAFSDCTSLTEIEIPSTVTFIAENAFVGSGIDKEPTV